MPSFLKIGKKAKKEQTKDNSLVCFGIFLLIKTVLVSVEIIVINIGACSGRFNLSQVLMGIQHIRGQLCKPLCWSNGRKHARNL